MGAKTRGSRTTWILAGLWLAAIVFAIAVAAQDTSGGGSLFSKILAGLGALATLTSLARDILPGDGPRTGAPDQPGDRSPAQDADRLADAVQQSWSEEAQVRRLHEPWLLPVPWTPAEGNLASVPEVVFRSPTTGILVPEDERGPAGGDPAALVERYVKLPNRRLVVLGTPGSGKSAIVIEMTLALLALRRPGDAVPVPLQLASWNPDVDLNEWLVQQLIENYSLTSDKHQNPQDIARELVGKGLVLAILDGLDEIPKELWVAAVRRLNHSLKDRQPLILTCRTDDYRATVRGGTVVAKSFAVELRPLDHATAQQYLTEASAGGDTTLAWRQVFDKVHAQPQGPLAMTFQSPLMISMAREIYCDGPHDPRDLLEDRFDSQDAIEVHLLSQLVPATYQQNRRAGMPLVGWPITRPEAWLRYLAAHGSGPGKQDIAWWKFERGVSPLVSGLLPAAVASGLVGYLLGALPGLLFGLVALAACSTWQARAWSLEAAIIRRLETNAASGSDPVRRERTARWAALTVGRLIAATAGVAYGYTVYENLTLYRAAAESVMLGLAVGLADGFFTISLRTTPTKMRMASYRGLAAFLRRFLIYLAMGSASTLTMWVLFHSPYAMLVVAVVFVIFGLIDSINVWLDVPTDITLALSPRSTRKDERFASVARSLTISLTLAAVTLALFWIASAPLDGIVPALVVGVGYGLADRLMGLATSVWGRYLIAKTWAAIRGDVPWRLMLFLDDAHRRGLLRQAGAYYQFRHARLQQHLAQAPAGERLREPRGVQSEEDR